jgi:hypothetical protein
MLAGLEVVVNFRLSRRNRTARHATLGTSVERTWLVAPRCSAGGNANFAAFLPKSLARPDSPAQLDSSSGQMYFTTWSFCDRWHSMDPLSIHGVNRTRRLFCQ